MAVIDIHPHIVSPDTKGWLKFCTLPERRSRSQNKTIGSGLGLRQDRADALSGPGRVTAAGELKP
jgi:hypothetical protein